MNKGMIAFADGLNVVQERMMVDNDASLGFCPEQVVEYSCDLLIWEKIMRIRYVEGEYMFDLGHIKFEMLFRYVTR